MNFQYKNMRPLTGNRAGGHPLSSEAGSRTSGSYWSPPKLAAIFTHVAISEAKDGKNLDWLEPVTDDQYRKGPR
jgi:hypothetical protein